MTSILTAVVALFNGSPSLAAVQNKLRSSRAEPVLAAPYVIMDALDGAGLAHGFDRKAIEYPRLQFTVYQVGAAAALDLATAVAAVFDFAQLTTTGQQCRAFVRRNSLIPRFSDRDEQGRDVYQVVLKYDLTIQN